MPGLLKVLTLHARTCWIKNCISGDWVADGAKRACRNGCAREGRRKSEDIASKKGKIMIMGMLGVGLAVLSGWSAYLWIVGINWIIVDT